MPTWTYFRGTPAPPSIPLSALPASMRLTLGQAAAYAGESNLQPISRDLGVSVAFLEAFIDEGALLEPKVLEALARELTGGHGAYDRELDLLRATHKNAATPLCAGYGPATLPGNPALNLNGEASVRPADPKATPKVRATARPGWA